jgi:hypothetical protein
MASIMPVRIRLSSQVEPLQHLPPLAFGPDSVYVLMTMTLPRCVFVAEY